MPHHPGEEVHRITDAEIPLSEEQVGRTRRYLWSMAVRTACFLGAIVAPSPWRWFLAVGALLLPYVAVVMANGGRERSDSLGIAVVDIRPERKALGP